MILSEVRSVRWYCATFTTTDLSKREKRFWRVRSKTILHKADDLGGGVKQTILGIKADDFTIVHDSYTGRIERNLAKKKHVIIWLAKSM